MIYRKQGLFIYLADLLQESDRGAGVQRARNVGQISQRRAWPEENLIRER